MMYQGTYKPTIKLLYDRDSEVLDALE